MAVGENLFPNMHPVPGVFLGGAIAGIKQQERPDILLIELAEGSQCAGVFTQNAFSAAPVQIARQHLSYEPRWLLINSGNANAGTGQQGLDDALQCCQSIADQVAARCSQVLPFSTGVIGENLPMDKMLAALPQAFSNLAEDHWEQAATAIMTTDTFSKGASEVIEIDGKPVTLTGISKGAGMIQPNMATMLGFIATDVNMSQVLLQSSIQHAADLSFNCISVDGDTSTNDALILMASGQSDCPEIKENTEAYAQFMEALVRINKRLAELIVRDGEGATKLIRIQVEQAQTQDEAMNVAKTIAHSPLVKTAFFASDPNWGRILAAVGRAGIVDFQIDQISIYLGDVCIVEKGGRALSYTEAEGQAVMDQAEITVRVVLARGSQCTEVLTCDLSYDYVKINAEYRT